jgi:hypothetical protein
VGLESKEGKTLSIELTLLLVALAVSVQSGKMRKVSEGGVSRPSGIFSFVHLMLP